VRGRGGGIHRRASDADPEALWSCLVFLLKGQCLVMVAMVARPVAMACHGLTYIGQGRWALAARRPERSSRHRGIDGHRKRCGGRGRSSGAYWPVPAMENTGQPGWLPCGSEEDTKRRMQTRARTSRLSALTQFSPTFGPGMGRSSPACLFGLGHWGGFYPFFVHMDAFGRAVSIWVSPLEMP
jgi:hypothetical protein